MADWDDEFDEEYGSDFDEDYFDDEDEGPDIWVFDIDDETGRVNDGWKADEDPGLGGCRLCGKQGPKARNVVAMDFTAPLPGTGWGCFACGLPMDGAQTVLCDDCVEGWQDGYIDITHVCKGYAADGERIGIDEYSHQPFDHNPRFHQDEIGTN